MSASEGLWQLSGFDIVDRRPPVVRLDVHLENYDTLNFGEVEETQAAAQPTARTNLTEWFKANEKNAGAGHMRYVDLPQNFSGI